MVLKYTLSKKVSVPQSNVEFHMYRQLHDFIYEMKGCITGWARKEMIDTDHGTVSYTCSNQGKEHFIAEVKHLITEIESKYSVSVIGDENGGFIINFE